MDWRSFRVDRMSAPELTGARFRQRELPAADALEYVQGGIASMPMRYAVRVRFEAPAETIQAATGHWATVEAAGEGSVMLMNSDSLDWPLMMIAGIDAAFTVEEPAELRELVTATAARLAASA
jgi:predicted DNA-binding transcriptional regulator YafY